MKVKSKEIKKRQGLVAVCYRVGCPDASIGYYLIN